MYFVVYLHFLDLLLIADVKAILGDDNVYESAASEAFPLYNKAHLISLQFPNRSGDVCFLLSLFLDLFRKV